MTTGQNSESCPPEIDVLYGNMEGQYFTQWRIDLLKDLLQRIVYAYGSTPLITIERPRVWYDAEQDFHRLEYSVQGKHIAVRFYKVFAAEINGVQGWTGCVQSSIGEFAKYLRDESRK